MLDNVRGKDKALSNGLIGGFIGGFCAGTKCKCKVHSITLLSNLHTGFFLQLHRQQFAGPSLAFAHWCHEWRS